MPSAHPGGRHPVCDSARGRPTQVTVVGRWVRHPSVHVHVHPHGTGAGPLRCQCHGRPDLSLLLHHSAALGRESR